MAEHLKDSPLCGENRGSSMLILSWTLLPIAIIIVTLRIWFRRNLRRGISWDDYFMIASLIVGIIGVGFLTKMIISGVGRHVYCLRAADVSSALRWSIYAQITNILGIGLVKISVCLCVLRVIDKVGSKLSRFLHLMIAFVSISHLAQVILFIVQCRPMAAIWNLHIDGQCFSSRVTYLAGYIGFGLDAFTDLVCAGIPIFVIYHLQINMRTKISLCVLMGLGVFTACCAIAKAVFLEGVFSKDYTYAITEPAMWTITEHLLGMIIASIPLLKPLFKRMLDMTNQAPGSSGRTFQRINGRERGVHVHISSRIHDGNRSRPSPQLSDKEITKTTELRMSTETDLEFGKFPKPPTAWGEPEREPQTPLRGYTHLETIV